MQVSDIIVTWTPETSGRVSAIQIRSRIAGTSNWSEQAASADAAAGTFRFTANAPDTDVEVQIRYRMTSGGFSPWVSATTHTAPAVVRYDTVEGAPKNVEDGATKGAPPGTEVGGRPVVQLIVDVDDAKGKAQVVIDALKKPDGTTYKVSDIVVDVDGLKATYGSTTSATESANKADVAKIAAEAARDIATQAKATTETARNAAQAAQTAAEGARDTTVTARDVTTSARDATIAARDITTGARDAAQAAQTGAQGAKDAAANAEATARQKASDAAQSASSASGSASTASGQATIATQKADAAGQSASNASASAQTASTAANSAGVSQYQAALSEQNAAGSRNAAASSATVSAASADAASASSKATVPSNFTDPKNWANWGNWGGSVTFADNLAKITNGGSIRSAFTMPVAAGETFRVTARHRTVNQGGGVTYIGLINQATGNYFWVIGGKGTAAVGVWETTVFEVTTDTIVAQLGQVNAVSIGFLTGYPTTSDAEVSSFAIVNITAEKNAQASASAAATNASNASTSNTNAGQSASAARTYSETASTKAGEAAGSASTAVTAKNDAQGSANAAASSASLSAGSATDAGTKAQAAATSASAAKTSETNAGQSASSASTSANAASTKAGEASASATNAATSESNAAGSRNAASSSASVAATSAQAASASAKATLPSNFSDPTNWSDYGGWGGTVTFANGVANIKNGGSFYTKFTMPIAAGESYRVTTRHRVINQGGGRTYIGLVELSPSGSAGGITWQIGDKPTAAVNIWETSVFEFTGDYVYGQYGQIKSIGVMFLTGYANISDGEVSMLKIENITSEKKALVAASAAATSASNAAASESNAGQSASASQGSATTASTKAGEASASAAQSASSASSASGSATAASSSASVAVTAAKQTFPTTFVDGDKYWSSYLPRTYSTEAGAWVYSNNATGNYGDITRRGAVPNVVGKKWKLRVRAKADRPGANMLLRVCGFTNEDLAGGQQGEFYRDSFVNLTTNYAWYEAIIDAPTDPSVPFIAPVCYPNYSNLNAIVSVAALEMTDATESANAGASASAAASSASNAKASETNAGQSASSASGSANTASTKAGEASSSANSAATSASNAEGSKNAAYASQTVAASAADASRDAAAVTLPGDFSVDGKFFLSDYSGSSATRAPEANGWSFLTTENRRVAQSIIGSGNVYSSPPQNGLASFARLTAVSGRKYRVSIEFRFRTSPGGDNNVAVYLINNSPNGVDHLTSIGPRVPAIPHLDTWEKFSTDFEVPNGWQTVSPFFRATGSGGALFQVASFKLEDITESTAASSSASSAATSASNAAASKNGADQAASAAQGSATNAATSAGNASTSASQASTSAGNAQGSANAAASSASVAASTYTKTVEATGNENFDSGTDGWIGAGALYPVANSGGRSNVIRSNTGAYIAPIQGRKVPITSSSQRFQLRCALRCVAGTSNYYVGAIFYDSGDNVVVGTDGTGNYPLGASYTVDSVTNSGWIERETIIGKGVIGNTYGGNTDIPAGAVYFRPCVFINYNRDPNSVTEIDYYTVTDVTAAQQAALSASAASTSAANASASANNAGQSASSASGSANTANTAAGQASTSASQAAGSASSASGSANTATSQASLAASSKDTAVKTVAANLPDSFANPTFWRNAWYGTDTRGFDLDSRYAFNGTTMTYSGGGGAGSIDIAHLGMTKLVPGRRRRLTAVWRILDSAGKPSVNGTIFFIGLNADGSAPITPGQGIGISSGQPGWGGSAGYATAIFECNDNDMINAGAGFTRGLFRFDQTVGGERFELVSLKLDDITSEAAAAGSASASAGSASTASTKADQAGQSASAANTAKLAAEAANGSAQGAASTAQSSAATANAKASEASSAATLAATFSGVSTGVSVNDRFANWPDGARNPVGWTDWSMEGGYTINRVGGIGSPYAAYTQHNADANCGFYQTCSTWPGKWVVEVTARRDAGSLSGAGVTLSGVFNIDFLGDPDTNGQIRDSNDGEIRTWVKTFDVNHGSLNLHAMGGWTGFGRSRASNYITWFKLNLRPAGPGDIAGVKNAARIDQVESANATALSSMAARQTVVEAQVSNDSTNLVRNSTFNAPGWARGGGVPPGWRVWSQDGSAYIGTTDRTSMYGAPYPLQIDRNGINNGIAQDIPGPIAQGWYSFSVDVYGEDGNWSGSGVHCNFNNGYAFNYGLAVNTDTGKRYGDIGNAMRRYTWMFYNPTQSNGATLYLMAGWSGFQGDTNFGFVRTIWHGINMRSSSEGEIVGKEVKSENLIARVQTSEGAISTLNGKNTAWLTQDVSAGDGRAIVSLRADGQTGSSNIDLAASSIRLFNPSGGDGSYIPALTVSNNNAVFSGAITASSYSLLSGGQRWRFQFASQDFQASNNEVITTPNFGALPKVEFGPCPVSLGANEVYQPRAENLSNTGFTAKLEILVPGTPSNYSLSGDYDGGNGLRARYLDGNPSSASGNYAIQAYGTASAFWAGGNTMPDDGGYVAVILGIFAYKNGAWTQVTTAYAYADIYLGGTKGTKTANWYLNDTFQLGGGVTHVAVQYQGREGGTAASLNNLTGVAWQAAGSSAGVRSATPNGEKVTVKVTPQ